MRTVSRAPLARSLVLTAFTVAAALALTSCKPAPAPKTASDDGVVTESFSVEDTGSAGRTGSGISSATVVSSGGSANSQNVALPTVTPPNPKSKPDPTPAPGTTWPVKVGAFAKEFKKPVWYPTYVPKGYALDSIDVVELDPGAGLTCSIVFTNKKTAVNFTQGSPTNRSYPIVSLGRVDWGDAKADLMHQDPADTNSPKMIVYSSGGNLAEVSGDAPEAELKAVAASMKPVTN